MNRKSKLISIFFLSSLLFISSINVSKAAPPSWVGVSVGDTFTWSIIVNVNTALAIVDDINSTGLLPNIFGPLDPIDLFGTQQEVKIKVNVLSITDLKTSNNIDYVNVSCSLTLILPGTTTVEDVTEFGNLILKYVPNNYTRKILEFDFIEMGPTLGALFIPTDINWAQLVTEVNLMIDMIPQFPSGLTFTALTNGVEATLTGQTLALPDIGTFTLSEIKVALTYNDDGVLDTVEIKYGGDVLLTFSLTGGTDAEIPSYEVSIVLITTLAASIGIIYYIKKRKKLD